MLRAAATIAAVSGAAQLAASEAAQAAETAGTVITAPLVVPGWVVYTSAIVTLVTGVLALLLTAQTARLKIGRPAWLAIARWVRKATAPIREVFAAVDRVERDGPGWDAARIAISDLGSKVDQLIGATRELQTAVGNAAASRRSMHGQIEELTQRVAGVERAYGAHSERMHGDHRDQMREIRRGRDDDDQGDALEGDAGAG